LQDPARSPSFALRAIVEPQKSVTPMLNVVLVKLAAWLTVNRSADTQDRTP